MFSISIFSQESLNDYKYIIVPTQYEFQKSTDSYKINSLTKFLFNKAGFIAILDIESIPNDLAKNRCLALTAKLNKGKGLFITKINMDLVNCSNTVIFSSKEATSREKDYKKAYHEVIRKLFNEIKAKNYKYTPKQTEEIITIDDFVKEQIVIKDEVEIIAEIVESNDVLYAKPIKNGFQLVNNTPELVYILQATSLKDVYFIKDKNGIVFKQNDKWFIEYYFNNNLIKRILNIKF